MKRWHSEEYLMLRRWREEIENHRDRNFGNVVDGCHCLLGKGFMRKRRPHDSHSSGTCALCRAQRYWARQERRRERRGQREHIARELQ